MAKDNSFDVVSEVNLQEVDNAINQAVKEINNRFDFKGSKTKITFENNQIIIVSDDDFKLKSAKDVLETKLVKRGIDLKALSYGKIEEAAGNTVRQRATLIQGIDKEKAKMITKLIKNSKIKVQCTIQGNQVRISGKNRDDLQAAIQLIKDEDFGIPLQFINFRTF
ncbi:YajQ family cyclic di-GMP-binding protein [Desulfolucanica intricata]|uniref:YajQ family cyclic di-GMP-binding protein n=1 Tax=Desulfolucanica intricata TaxID=1285191 RepID=UPI00082DC3BA|nr:YajQ family cyclic di-GMP-binding protein [Desulfolucanica intricata]